MKILMTSDTFLPRLGGGEYHVWYLMRELRRQGHDVRLYTTEPGNDEADDDGTMRLSYRGVRSLPSILRSLWNAADGVDLIHSHYSYRLGFLAAIVACLRRVPFVVTQHGLGLLPQAKAPLWQRIPFRVWRWWNMRVARVVVSTSDDLSVDIRALGFGSKIVHIPNGYDDARFMPLPAPPPHGDAPVILTVRRLVPKNGIQYLIAALPRIRERFPNVRYVCVGDGRLATDIRELATALGVIDRITFLGESGHDTLVDLYREADVVVIPSTAESTSLSCIEAMALGKTIVASRVGGLIELLGRHEERGALVALTESEHCDYDAPMTIAPEKIAALADAVIDAVAHPERSAAKAAAAAAYAPSHFAWPLIARRTVEEAYGPAMGRA